jgi:hypothetical protein
MHWVGQNRLWAIGGIKMGDVIRFVTRWEADEIARRLATEPTQGSHRRTPIATVNGYDIIAASNVHGRVFLVHGHSDDKAFLEFEAAKAFANQQPMRKR